MISLCVCVLLIFSSVLLCGWTLALAARSAGSSRGGLWVGIKTVLLLTAVTLPFAIAANKLPAKEAIAALSIGMLLLLAQFTLTFFVLRRMFVLTSARTFWPFGAYIAISVIEIVLVVGLVRPFLIQAFNVPARSMVPTIEPGDRFFVCKLLHPRRWDLVVYRGHDSHSMLLCKRLVGLPGERLRFEQGAMFVDDKPILAPPVLAGRLHASVVMSSMRYGRYRDGDTIVLGGNDYFFIGDNVDNSMDSRLQGPTDRSQLVGVIDLMYWPPGRARIVR